MCRLCYAALPLATAENRIGEAVDQCIDASILPGLTVGTPNPGLGHELWRLIEKRPHTALPLVRHPPCSTQGRGQRSPRARYGPCARTADETKRMMRRLSKENTRQYGRHLGKLTHVVPSIVFDTMLEQIQAYDNLIVPVVEMMRYLTPMSFDVLTFIILSHLASPQKTQMKTDGLNVSMWMQSLSSFCGNLYKKYPSIELVGLLQYIANTLKSGTSLQLLLLRDLVTKMAGIEPLEDLSVDQLEAHAGGETLKTSVTDVLGIAKNTKRSSTRLREALVKHGLVVPLFLLIAQQRARASSRQTRRTSRCCPSCTIVPRDARAVRGLPLLVAASRGVRELSRPSPISATSSTSSPRSPSSSADQQSPSPSLRRRRARARPTAATRTRPTRRRPPASTPRRWRPVTCPAGSSRPALLDLLVALALRYLRAEGAVRGRDPQAAQASRGYRSLRAAHRRRAGRPQGERHQAQEGQGAVYRRDRQAQSRDDGAECA